MSTDTGNTPTPAEGSSGPHGDRAATDTALPAAPPVRSTEMSARSGPSPRLTTLLRSGLIGLAVLAAVTAAVLGWMAYSASAGEQAAGPAGAAAKVRVAAMLSYAAPTLDADLARARQQVTPEFAPKYDQLATKLVDPTTRRQQVSTRTTVTRTGVISAKSDEVQFIVFVNQQISAAGQPAPIQRASQAKVTMSEVDGNWLISDVVPL